MARSDYSEDDDYYSQGFEQKGVVSVWASSAEVSTDTQTDALQDLCGVGYYNLDNQEANARAEIVPLEVLLSEISYSGSFLANALGSANRIGAGSSRWVVVQFDFAYDPARVSRPISPDLVFIGAFPYADA